MAWSGCARSRPWSASPACATARSSRGGRAVRSGARAWADRCGWRGRTC
nr:MAG TPA: hypothetical protein [Caudoviricetes sp.]